MLAVMHTSKNFAEKGLDYFFLLFNVAYNLSHYFLLLFSDDNISSSLSCKRTCCSETELMN